MFIACKVWSQARTVTGHAGLVLLLRIETDWHGELLEVLTKPMSNFACKLQVLFIMCPGLAEQSREQRGDLRDKVPGDTHTACNAHKHYRVVECVKHALASSPAHAVLMAVPLK